MAFVIAVISCVWLIGRKNSATTPFVYGFVRPKIHIPGRLEGEELRGEGGIKERIQKERIQKESIQNVLKFNKASKIVIAAAVALAVSLTVGLTARLTARLTAELTLNRRLQAARRTRL